MKNLKTKVVALFIAVASLCSINAKAQGDFLITNEGEKVLITSDVSLYSSMIKYEKDKKEVYYDGKNIKYLQVGGKEFITVHAARKDQIMQIICYDDKYILTTAYGITNYPYYFIFDWDLQMLQYTAFPPPSDLKKEKKFFNQYLLPFFNDNTTIMKAINENMDNIKGFSSDIHSLKGGTKNINALIKDYIDGKIVGGKEKLNNKKPSKNKTETTPINTTETTANSLNPNAQTGYVLTNSGKKESVYGTPYIPVDKTSVTFYYTSKASKEEYYKSNTVMYAFYEDNDAQNKQALALSIEDKEIKKILYREVIAYNDKYILTRCTAKKESFGLGTTLLLYISTVYDWNFNVVAETGSYFNNTKLENAAIAQIEPYFKDCTNLVNAMKLNVNNPNEKYGKNMFYRISNVQCGTKNMDALIDAFLKSPAGQLKRK